MRLKEMKNNDNMELINFNNARRMILEMVHLSCKIFRENELHYGW